MRFQFRVNKVEIAVALRAGKGNRLELIAVDSQVGEFYVSEEDEIEARDAKLAEALRPQLHGGWKKITAPQAVTMLVEINGKRKRLTKKAAQKILAAVDAWGDKPMPEAQLRKFGYIKTEGGVWELPTHILKAAGVK